MISDLPIKFMSVHGCTKVTLRSETLIYKQPPLLGQVTVGLAPVVNSAQPLKKPSTRLSSGKDEPLNSTIDFVITYHRPPGALPPPGAGGGGGGGDAVSASPSASALSSPRGPIVLDAPAGGGGGGDGLETVMLDGDGDAGSERSGSPARSGAGGPSRKKRRTKVAKAQIQHELGKAVGG